MWSEIQDMQGEIFDLDIDDREMMPLDMQEDIEQEDPLLWREDSWLSGTASVAFLPTLCL